MVDQLSAFADEVTRVAREVGTEGKLGGQAEVAGVSGTWSDLTENVNLMASNLTEPGTEHRAGDDRGGTGRPVEEDHGRRPRGDPRAQGHDQHDGRPAAVVRGRGDPRRPRGRHRGNPRRPGRGRGRVGHLEGPDRERQSDGVQPDHPGAVDRRRDDRSGARRSLPEDQRRRQGRGRGARRDDQPDGRSAARVRGRGDARRARSGNRGNPRRPGPGPGCRRHLEGSH